MDISLDGRDEHNRGCEDHECYTADLSRDMFAGFSEKGSHEK